MVITGPIARPLLVGSAGAAATLAMFAASRALSSPVMPTLQDLAATAVAPPGSAAGEAAGMAAQVVNGGLFAQLYDIAFKGLPLEPGWASGAAIGAAHGVLAGAILGIVPGLHPRVPEQQPDPGAFMHRHGSRAAVVLIGLHVLYGALVGAAIAATRPARCGHARRESRR